jgi:hypothetical protein
MNILRCFGPRAQPGVAYMVTHGIFDDYTVLCVCADQGTARKRARAYNRDHPAAWEDARARVEQIPFIPAANAA